MKKWITLILAVVLCMSASMSLAEENRVKLETVTLTDGFTFAVPTSWKYRKITHEKDAGVVMIAYDESMDLLMFVMHEPTKGNVTARQLAQEMAMMPEEFCFVQVYTNAYGQEMVLYEFADHSLIGYCVVLEDGNIATFNYGRYTDSGSIAKNEPLKHMLMDSIENVYYKE
ncbi:MAG: hypothetical protein E7331_10775 [Clostridiales bacterium]|nr:hypothetical protein [Clostridiales bacterium]